MSKREEELDFDKIAQIFKGEKGSQKLLDLPPTFYHQVNDYLTALKVEAKAESEKGEGSTKLTMLEDEIKKSERRLKQVRELRERKIALLAVLKANGGVKKEIEMTPEELALYKDMVKVIRSHKDTVTREDRSEKKERREKEPAPEAEEEPQKEVPQSPEQAPENEPEEKQRTIEEATREAQKLKVLQVLEDIPPFLGDQVTYVLRKDDLVSLPNELADLLCNRGKAAEIKVE